MVVQRKTDMEGKEKIKGEWLALLHAVLWAFFPIIMVVSYAKLPSLVSLAWGTMFAAIVFAGIISYRRKWNELKNLLLWKYGCYIALSIGVIFYGLYFIGLEFTTAGNVAILGQFEVFTSFFLFNVLRREIMSLEYKIGAVLMVLGAVIVLGRDFTHFNIGDFLILIGTFATPLGNLYQQKARMIASSESIMFLRSALSAPPIFLLAYLFYGNTPIEQVYGSLPILLLSGILFLGLSKVVWIESVHRISVTKAIALSSVAPLITLFLAWPTLHQTPNIWQFTSLVPMFLGVLLLTDNLKLKRLHSRVS